VQKVGTLTALYKANGNNKNKAVLIIIIKPQIIIINKSNITSAWWEKSEAFSHLYFPLLQAPFKLYLIKSYLLSYEFLFVVNNFSKNDFSTSYPYIFRYQPQDN